MNQELLPVVRHRTEHPVRWLGKTLGMRIYMHYAMILKIPIVRRQRIRSSMCITSRLRYICCAAMAGSWPRTAVVKQTLGDDRIRHGQPEISASGQWTVLLVDLRGSRPSSPSHWLIQGSADELALFLCAAKGQCPSSLMGLCFSLSNFSG